MTKLNIAKTLRTSKENITKLFKLHGLKTTHQERLCKV
jgi:hypothetical protein